MLYTRGKILVKLMYFGHRYLLFISFNIFKINMCIRKPWGEVTTIDICNVGKRKSTLVEKQNLTSYKYRLSEYTTNTNTAGVVDLEIC